MRLDMPQEVTLPKAKTNTVKRMVMYRAMQEWNVLPEQITQESSKRRFKSLVKTYLLIREVE